MKPLREIACGLVNKGEDKLKVSSPPKWGMEPPQHLPHFSYNVVSSINNIVIHANFGRVDKLVWNLTSNGIFSTKCA